MKRIKATGKDLKAVKRAGSPGRLFRVRSFFLIFR